MMIAYKLFQKKIQSKHTSVQEPKPGTPQYYTVENGS